MSLWIKVCANTSLEDARFAANAGADAVGFVFAPSPRRITFAQVAEITPRLPDAVEKIGVFVNTEVNEIAATVRGCRLNGVQLHSECGTDAAVLLRAEFGSALRILRVVHFGPEAAGDAARYAADPNVDAILVDSRTATAQGGTGVAFDWDTAARTVFANGAAKLIAAGGLRPDNVAEAIAKLRPWGVDVASGVERELGQKDPARVRAFIENARATSSDRA